MKLTAVLLLAACLQVAARADGQTVTLKVKNATIKEVFRKIQKQTGLNVMVDEVILEQAGRVTLDVTDMPVLEVLNICLKNESLIYSIVDGRIVVKRSQAGIFQTEVSTKTEVPPPLDVKGKVSDENGNALSGASVVLKETGKGTTTNAEGNFSIELPNSGGILIVSYVGYEEMERKVQRSETLNFTLKPKDTKVEDFVIVGYGKQKKLEVTSAVSQISSKEILQSQSFSVSNSLAGKVPGLIVNQRNGRPGADEASVYIRGISTVGNTAALIVVDGIANRDGISRLDPNDIETISVLKDASAAIYGAQSANGVILITTKRGKSGKPVVSYSANYGIVSPTRYIKPSNAATFAKGLNDVDLQDGASPRFTPQQIADYENGVLPSTNWAKEVYKKNFSQSRHNLSIRGGSDAVKYFLSIGLGQQGTLLVRDDKSKYKQYNFRSNIDATVSKNLTVGLDISARRENRNNPGIDDGNLFSWVILTSPLLPATILGGYPAAGRGNNNPIAVVASDSYDRTENNIISGTLRSQLKIPGVEGLSIDGFAAIDYFQSFQKFWRQPWTYYEDVNGIAIPKQRPYGPDLSVNSQRNQSITLNSKINYRRSFGLHVIDAFVSYEENRTKMDRVSAFRTGFVSPVIDQIFAGSPVKTNQSNDGSATEGARQNYLSRISYAYDNKYLAQFYIGINGSQIFPKETRFGKFPGGSVGWVISKETFMRNVSFVTSLKLRASYGLLGNDRVAQFQYLNLFGFGGGYVFNGLDVASLNPGVAANPNITWEKKRNTDIGLDFSLFNNSITGTIDYFRSRTSDILARKNATVPGYTGLSLPNQNIGIVDNKGFDGEINYTKKVNDLRFNAGVNFTYAKNKIVFIDEVSLPSSAAHQAFTGKPIGTQLIYKVIGIYQTAGDLTKFPALPGARVGDLIYEDYNKDGQLNSDDRYPLAENATPRFQYGINLGAEWKSFDFIAQFQGQAKAVQLFTYIFGEANNAPEYYVKNAWTPTNTEASLPRIGRNNSDNDLFVRDVSFVRLKNIELGYSLPKQLLSKIGFQSTRIFINGYNLLTFDKLKKDGLGDPESVMGQNWVFPQTKIISFGVNANF